jgi:hypothetical protein
LNSRAAEKFPERLGGGGHRNGTVDGQVHDEDDSVENNGFMSCVHANIKPKTPVSDVPGFWQGLKAIIFASCA